jgi:hypothetical protein
MVGNRYLVNYYKTYLPVVSWFSVCLCLTIFLIFRQIDFVPAFPQEPIWWNVTSCSWNNPVGCLLRACTGALTASSLQRIWMAKAKSQPGKSGTNTWLKQDWWRAALFRARPMSVSSTNAKPFYSFVLPSLIIPSLNK